MKKTTYISIAIALIVLSIAVPMAGAQVTVTTTNVRYRFTSIATATTYYIPSLSWYYYQMAVFTRDGVLYVAYDNYDNSRGEVVRLDTGEVVRVCPYGDYDEIEAIVASNGTAYAAIHRWVYTGNGWRGDVRIVELWNCSVIAEFIGNPYNFVTEYLRYYYYMFFYDYYHNRLVYVFRNMTGNSATTWDNVVVFDLNTGNVTTIFRIIFATGYVDSILITQDYYYINIYYGSDPVALYVYDARSLSLVGISNGLPTTCNDVRYGLAPLDYNRFGILYLKVIGEDTSYPGYPKPEFLRITMCDYSFSNCVEYPTDFDNTYGRGVRAYKDVFVVASNKDASTRSPVIASIFLPDKGLLINTTITGYAIPVDYNLWYSNRIVLYDGNGTFYVIDPPVTIVTETATVTNTVTSTFTATETTTTTTTATTTTTLFHNVTTTVTTTTTMFNTTTVTTTQTIANTVTVTTTTTETYATITVTETQTVTTTAAPYLSIPSSWLLLLMLILIVLAITGVIKMASKSIIAQKMEFVKKK